MMMYYLDTDTFTHTQMGNKKVVSRVESVGAENIGTTIINAIEILRGRHEFVLKAADGAQLLRAQQLLDESEAILLESQIFRVNDRAANEFERLRLNKKLKPIGRRDVLIGCIALAHNATLVTRNLEDFRRIPHLKLENWID
jgi:tRNA(fMet)-specific endonuclease VapC